MRGEPAPEKVRAVAQALVPIYRAIDWDRWPGRMRNEIWTALESRIRFAARTESLVEFVERFSQRMEAQADRLADVIEQLSRQDAALYILRNFPKTVVAYLRDELEDEVIHE